MNRHVLMFAGLMGIALGAGSGLAAPPQRHAVVVGINDYADPAIPDLKFAESDAKAVYDTLTDPAIGKFPKENAKLLVGKDATAGNIKAALHGLRGVAADDLVVVFYSGHGAKEGDEAFWVTQDAQAKALPATALPNGDIRKFLANVPSQRLVLLLDCCYAASTVKKDLADPGKLFGEFAGKGRVTIAGAADNQEALEYEARKAGVFSYFLTQGLAGSADANTDGVVTFEELWSFLSGNVRAASVKQGGLHEPVLISEGGITPQFLLTFNPKVAAASVEAVKALRSLFEADKITGRQFDDGRKALSEPALDDRAKALREVFADLAAGRLDPKYLQGALDRAPAGAGAGGPIEIVKPGQKPTLAVIPLEELGRAKGQDFGRMLAERWLPAFAEKYELIDQAQLAAFLKQDDLTVADLAELASPKPTTKSLSKAVKLRAVRYLVVGSVSGYPDGTLSVTARLCDWQSGRVEADRIGQVGGADWAELVNNLPALAGRLMGAPVALPVAAGPAKELSLDLGNNVKMKLVLIPAGKFLMGSPASERSRSDDEGPQHEVTISRPFYMGVHEVTQEQYEQVMGKNPSKFKGPQNPVETVSWDEAMDFCRKLSAKTGKTVRLPTEAQWEYACRAGSRTRFSFGDDDQQLREYSRFVEDVGTVSVGRFKPNAFGLHDMHGNVWEWCGDWYAGSYVNAPQKDPEGPEAGEYRVARGGSWNHRAPASCRSAIRTRYSPVFRNDDFGFRVAVDLK